jgi:hypothetical protein
MRKYLPDMITCPNCNEWMELKAVLKIYPGFGIGRITIRAYFRLGDFERSDPGGYQPA